MAAPLDGSAEREPLLAGPAPVSYLQSTAAESSQVVEGGGQALAVAVPLDVSAAAELPGASLQRQSSIDGRQQFQAARQGALRDAAMTSQSWRTPLGAFCFVLGVILLLTPPVVIIYIEIRSWHAVFAYGNLPCDQDLVFWLVIRNIMFLIAPPMPSAGDPDQERATRQRRAVQLSSTLWFAWLIVGWIWSSSCQTCQKTNPELYTWVRFVTIFSLVIHFLKIFFPLLILLCAMTYHSLVAHGWLKSPNAASDNTIERMEKVEFREGFFGGSGPDAPPAECCCCMESFSSEKDIVKTPCLHYYHYDCLKEWLKVAKTCPMCRNDLDVEPATSSSTV